MTQLEILAAKIRGAENNEQGAKIISDWYELKTRSAAKLASESAEILRKDSDNPITGRLNVQAASNLDSIAKMLKLEND